MRHLYGVAAAIIMAAVMYFAGAWGYLRLITSPVPASGGSLTQAAPLLALGAVIGTAVLAGLLVTVRRISPLAAGLPGIGLLAWTGLYAASGQRAVDLIPLRSHAFGAGWHGLLVSGVLGAAGAVMVFPLFVPSRWREPRRGRHAAPDTSARDADDFLSTVRPDDWPRQRDEEPELTGTVMPSLVGAAAGPADTARISGAAQALRNTGSFPTPSGGPRPATGPFPSTASGLPRRTTGSFRAVGDIPRRATGSFRAVGDIPRRATGSFRAGADASLLGRPAPDAGE